MAASMGETWRSKLNNKYQKKDIDSWDSRLKSELRALKKQGVNMNCFDCGTNDSSWASPKLGIFICVACSDVHRAAGAHITCVKNFSTYLWGPDEVELMKAVGNGHGRQLYGAREVEPSDSKEHKVAMCTRRYGTPQVQQLIAEHVRAATASAAAGPSELARRQTATESALRPQPRSVEAPAGSLLDDLFASDAWGNIEPRPQPAATQPPALRVPAALKLGGAADGGPDWFDDLFPSKGHSPAARRGPAAHVEPLALAESREMEDFLAGFGQTGAVRGHGDAPGPATCKDLDLLFENFGNW